MAKPRFNRLRLAIGGLTGTVTAVLGMGGPKGTADAIKATIDFVLLGSSFEGASWLATDGLTPARPYLFAAAALSIAWALFPIKRVISKEASHTPPAVKGSAALLALEMSIGPGSALSPENRLIEAYAKFHSLADRADRGDLEGAELAKIVAPWAREAARFYFASSPPFHRIEQNILSRLSRFDDSPAVRRHIPPNDPVEIDRGAWELHYDPSRANGMKTITFLPTGQIGDGRNHNEATWELRGNDLSIFRADGTLQNEFIYIAATRQFSCANAPNALGIKNQTIRRRTS